jgi:hypothetical protein
MRLYSAVRVWRRLHLRIRRLIFGSLAVWCDLHHSHRLQLRVNIRVEMPNKSKFGIALALMLLVVATAPAVQCITYLPTQNQAQDHSCCPKNTVPADTVVPTCCIHSPAVTSQSIDVPAPSLAVGPTLAIEPPPVFAAMEGTIVPDLDTSPPHCSSILRI